MTEQARAECLDCPHVGALHGTSGCRVTGCHCAGFTDSRVPAPADPAEAALARQRADRVADARIARLERDLRWLVAGLVACAGLALAALVIR